ncbi:MAG TPA: YicC/YloC family endoribonuclease [Terriglobales bacterium]|nr:YicC/YloC family endoribonuclease [Terriglobales bacterium]
MAIRSMTGFAQVTGQANGRHSFNLSLKSLNHRFLDLHFRMPPGTEELEMKVRRRLKERLIRGHVELVLNLETNAGESFRFNREWLGGYLEAFRAVAREFGLAAEPDLNLILRLPGAFELANPPADPLLEEAILAKLDEALARLNEMREQEGRDAERDLRERMRRIERARQEVEKCRQATVVAYQEQLHRRMQELIGSQVEPERILQEAALLADRSDIAEELVRLESHIQQFLGLLDQGGEVGKKLDFLLQEMNRESNTLLSKTAGLAGEALQITTHGLGMKADIEKAREQVQNLE